MKSLHPQIDRTPRSVIAAIAVGGLTLVALYLLGLRDYLLFHILAELLTIIVAGSIFLIVWNTRHLMTNDYVAFLGVAYLFVGAIDLIHTLTYQGMAILPQYGNNVPTQLWIAARAMQSVALLVAPLFFVRKIRYGIALLILAGAFFLMTSAILWWGIFPTCYVDGVGLTEFKKIAEYAISFVLIAGWLVLWRNRARFRADVFTWLSLSVVLAIGSELAFTFYVSVYGLSNFIGHLLKLASFFALYKAIVETGLRMPHALLFKELNDSERALEVERDFAEGLIETAQLIVLVLDTQGRILRFNHYMEELSGYRSEDVVGKDWITTFLPPRDHDAIRRKFVAAFSDEPTRGNVNSIVTRGGEERLIEWFDRSFRDKEGMIAGLISIGTDVTERQHTEELLRHAATTDYLTDVPNRALFDDLLRVGLARARRDNTRLAVISLDLDHFKDINDSHGHAVGDQVLAAVASRLLGAMRKSDTIARLGGDEFAVLCPVIDSAQDVVAIAEKILATTQHPIAIDGVKIAVALSIGAALFPDHGETVVELLRSADTAMYGAKRAGRGTYRLSS